MLIFETVSDYIQPLIQNKLTRDILHLIFPSACCICGSESPSNETVCHFCKEELLYTRFELMNEPNDLDKLFWGRARVEGTYSLLYFSKNTSTQKLLHALKYQNKPETGLVLGREIGLRIKALSIFNSIDVLIPVPIHAKKQFVRGYNQSEQLASGISQITSIPVNKKVIKKQKETVSQTNRNRFERWDNVYDNFLVKNTITQFRHIAIVDDVITTGATLESLIKAIHAKCPELRISIISLALTK